jgi:hypothetical protein
MRHSVSKDLYDYWNKLRGARTAPDRNDIDPAAIRHVLPDSFILEIDPACLFPIRLCGTRLSALWLRDQKGASFLELWRPEERRSVAAALLTVIDGAAPVIAGVRAHAPEAARLSPDSPARCLDFELLLLPLRHFGKTHSRVLGSLASFNQASWFGRFAASRLDLVSSRVIRGHEQARIHRPMATAPRLQEARVRRLVVYEGGRSRL